MTGDEPQGTMGRVQTVVSIPPSFARTVSSKERRLGTRQVLLIVIEVPSVKRKLSLNPRLCTLTWKIS